MWTLFSCATFKHWTAFQQKTTAPSSSLYLWIFSLVLWGTGSSRWVRVQTQNCGYILVFSAFGTFGWKEGLRRSHFLIHHHKRYFHISPVVYFASTTTSRNQFEEWITKLVHFVVVVGGDPFYHCTSFEWIKLWLYDLHSNYYFHIQIKYQISWLHGLGKTNYWFYKCLFQGSVIWL